jgi:hypothetical protein
MMKKSGSLAADALVPTSSGTVVLEAWLALSAVLRLSPW